MNKILKGILTVAVVSLVGVYATNAYFSDTETSTGNTFQTGAIDLTVGSSCTYNGQTSSECGNWEAQDLGVIAADKFFNFTDLKPGDYGENTISLHVETNDAYMCATINNMHDNDLSLTEPETEFDSTVGADEGELAQELHFFAWQDNGDNVWELGETPLFSNIQGPASDVLGGVVYPLYTLATSVFPGGQTKNLGIYWCYGDLTANEGTNTLSCDGSAVTNATQTDALTADISFYVEQARNNTGFKCPGITQVVDRLGTPSILGWYQLEASNDSVVDRATLVSGPATPPLGTGSARVPAIASQRTELVTSSLGPIKLSDLTELSFWTYNPSTNGANEYSLYLQFNVSFDGNDTWQKRLVFVPRDNGTVQQNTWQKWDALNGGTTLWSRSGGQAWPNGDTGLKTWNQILTLWPNAQMRLTDNHTSFRAGEPYATDFVGYVDAFTVGVNGVNTTFNFED